MIINCKQIKEGHEFVDKQEMGIIPAGTHHKFAALGNCLNPSEIS